MFPRRRFALESMAWPVTADRRSAGAGEHPLQSPRGPVCGLRSVGALSHGRQSNGRRSTCCGHYRGLLASRDFGNVSIPLVTRRGSGGGPAESGREVTKTGPPLFDLAAGSEARGVCACVPRWPVSYKECAGPADFLQERNLTCLYLEGVATSQFRSATTSR